MKSSIYQFTHWVTYITIFHGFIYYIVKYFLQVETEYGLRAHPTQGLIQGIHIALSPLLIFAFGVLFKDHIIKMYQSAKKKRKTGVTLTLTMFIMIFSGYAIQVIYVQTPKMVSSYIHIGISLLFTLAYLIHHLLRR
jgi:hypothetical protein